MTAQEYKARLVELVITQIIQDDSNGDTTAIHEMFDQVDDRIMEAFLPEDTLELFVNGEQA
jgi:hypothetical protein